MSKHDIAKDICGRLNIHFQDSFISGGGTVTKDLLIEITKSLTNSDRIQKQDLFRLICAALDITTDPSWFSSGSTITSEGWEALLSGL